MAPRFLNGEPTLNLKHESISSFAVIKNFQNMESMFGLMGILVRDLFLIYLFCTHWLRIDSLWSQNLEDCLGPDNFFSAILNEFLNFFNDWGWEGIALVPISVLASYNRVYQLNPSSYDKYLPLHLASKFSIDWINFQHWLKKNSSR